MSEEKHCWHVRSAAMQGKKTRLIEWCCCHCGAQRKAVEYAAGADPAHGKHVSTTEWRVIDEMAPIGACVATPAEGR
jgi:hypothetical protein